MKKPTDAATIDVVASDPSCGQCVCTTLGTVFVYYPATFCSFAVVLIPFSIIEGMDNALFSCVFQRCGMQRPPLRTIMPGFFKFMLISAVELWILAYRSSGKLVPGFNRLQHMAGASYTRDWRRQWSCRAETIIPLRIESRSDGMADVLLPEGAGPVLAASGPGPQSLTASLEACVLDDLRNGPLAKAVTQDTDVAAPLYFLHGTHEPIADLNDPSLELWVSQWSSPRWPAMYCHCFRVSRGQQDIYLSPHPDEDPEAWSDDPSRAVVGYIYLLGIDKSYYSAPGEHFWTHPPGYAYTNKDPEKRKKIARRFMYMNADLMGMPTDRPDAFVFTQEAAREAGLKVVRTYRIVNPYARL